MKTNPHILTTPILLAADKDANGASKKPPAFYDPVDMKIVETLDIDPKDIKPSGVIQSRVQFDEDHSKEMAEAIKKAIEEKQFNPFDELDDALLPVVFRDTSGKLWMADGVHRLDAHKKAHAPTFRIAVRNGTERDALLYSAGVNSSHGLKRSNKDKNRSVKLLTHDPEWSQWSDNEIARLTRTSTTLVKSNRLATKNPTKVQYKTKGGKVATMDKSNIGKGKGAGKKAKADDKPEKKRTPEQDAAELDKALVKIAEHVGGDEGGKVRRGVLDGKIELARKDVLEWASFSPAKIKAVTPLVVQEGWKPAKAFDFLAESISDKAFDELRLRCLGAGGEYATEVDGFIVLVTRNKK